jgi:hypothetical protein
MLGQARLCSVDYSVRKTKLGWRHDFRFLDDGQSPETN